MKNLKSFVLIAVTAMFCSTSLFAGRIQSDTSKLIIIKVDNVLNDKGKILVMAKIPGVADPVYGMTAAKKGEVIIELKNVKGDSAEISLFHDQNGNYKMDMGERGPAEGYVTKKCKLKEPTTQLKVSIYYPDNSR